MRILYIGTGDIGVPALRWLVGGSGHEIVGVVCQPDRPAGRKLMMTPPATKVVAAAARVPVFQPEKIKEAVGEIAGLRPDVSVVMAYGQYLPRAVREAACVACLNLHASLLPRWRGASPVQAAIAAGDSESGISMMHVGAGMDTGDLILAERTPIRPDDTGGSLHDRLAELAPVALAAALRLIEAGTAPRTPQSEAGATYCARLERDDGIIDWARPAIELERLIRAYDPWPGTTTRLPDGGRIKIFPPARIIATTAANGPPGRLLSAGRDGLLVQTGAGGLVLSDLQPEGKRRMTAQEFLAGHPLQRGESLAG